MSEDSLAWCGLHTFVTLLQNSPDFSSMMEHVKTDVTFYCQKELIFKILKQQKAFFSFRQTKVIDVEMFCLI